MRQVERYLDQAQWTAVLEFIETLPQAGRRERQHYERARWVVRFLYDTALRVSEAAQVILSIAGRAEDCLTPTAVYLIVKDAFGQTADALGESDPVTAAVLRRASTHWLRHTAASHQADSGTDLPHIQKNLRHASIETTAIYLHTTDDARHRDTTGR